MSTGSLNQTDLEEHKTNPTECDLAMRMGSLCLLESVFQKAAICYTDCDKYSSHCFAIPDSVLTAGDECAPLLHIRWLIENQFGSNTDAAIGLVRLTGSRLAR